MEPQGSVGHWPRNLEVPFPAHTSLEPRGPVLARFVLPEFECIGRYRLTNLIGGGGMGRPGASSRPRAGHPQGDEGAAAFSRNEQCRSLFSREADVAAQLGRHPGVPTIHDFDASGAFAYLVMD